MENKVGHSGGEPRQLIRGDASQPQTSQALGSSVAVRQHATPNQGSQTAGGTQPKPQQLDTPANARRKRNGAEMSDKQRERKRMSDKKFKTKLKEKQEAIKFERDELLNENVRLKQEKDEIMMKRTDELERENEQLKREIREKEQLFNSKLEALQAQIREKDDQRVKAAKEKFEALLAKQKSDAEKKQLDFENKVLQRDLENAKRLNLQLRQSIEQQDRGNSMLRQSYNSRGCWPKQAQIFLALLLSTPEQISTLERVIRQPISTLMSVSELICSLSSLRYLSYLHSGEKSELKRLKSLCFEPLKSLESLSLHLDTLPLRTFCSGPLPNFTDSAIFLLVINNKKITKNDAETVRSLASFAIGIARLYPFLCSISKLSSFHSSFHQRAEIMVDGMISALQHPYLVKLYGCCIEANHQFLLTQENNSLARAWFGPNECQLKLDWPVKQKMCISIARCLAYLHEESRLKMMKDIKPTNILLDKDLNLKISDFGLSKLDEEDNTHISPRIARTMGYMAPEYATWGYLTYKSNVYSFGIMALESFSGRSNTSSITKENSLYLIDWALRLKEKGNLLELVEPRLGFDYNKKEAYYVFCSEHASREDCCYELCVNPGMFIESLKKFYQILEEEGTQENQTQSMSIESLPLASSSSSAVTFSLVNLSSGNWYCRLSEFVEHISC